MIHRHQQFQYAWVRRGLFALGIALWTMTGDSVVADSSRSMPEESPTAQKETRQTEPPVQEPAQKRKNKPKAPSQGQKSPPDQSVSSPSPAQSTITEAQRWSLENQLPVQPYGWYGGYPRYNLGVGYTSAVYFYPPIAGVFRQIDPNLIIYPPVDKDAIEVAPPTGPELLYDAKYSEAAEVLAVEIAQSPNDTERKRLLAVANAGLRDYEAAAAVMLDVYESDPEIAVYPLDQDGLFESSLDLRRLVVGAVRYAQRVGTARAWLLVAVLMQAEGRENVAAEMLNRAAAQGLDDDIVKAWPTTPSP